MRQPGAIGAVLAAGVFALAANVVPADAGSRADGGRPGDIAARQQQARANALGLEDLFKRFRIDEHSVGYIAVDAATGAVLTARVPDGAFVPASAIKASTAVMALEVLGPKYRAETRLYRSGTIGGGALKGDLVLIGGGDPELYTEDFLPMIRALKKQGIRRIEGRFLFDDSHFPEARAVSGAHNIDAAYNPGVGALSLNFNRLRLNWRRSGKSLTARIFSKTDKMVVPVDIVTAGVAPAGTQAPRGVVRAVEGGTPRWMVVPTAKRSGAMWVPVKRPGLVAAHVFQQLAGQHGIAVPDPERGALPAGAAVVAVHRSEPLIEAVRHFLKYSNNVATEIIGLATTRRIAGAPLDLAQSGAAMAAWWRRQVPGADRSGLRIANHSGLSRETRISPRQMAAFLRWARDRDYAGRRLWDLMQPYWVGAGKARATRPQQRNGNHAGSQPGRSAAGRSGPVRAGMQIRGKTGTLNHARSLAGYMVTRSGREVVFAVFLDDNRAFLAAGEAGRRYRQLKPARWAWRSRVVLNTIVRKIMLEF